MFAHIDFDREIQSSETESEEDAVMVKKPQKSNEKAKSDQNTKQSDFINQFHTQITNVSKDLGFFISSSQNALCEMITSMDNRITKLLKSEAIH